MDAFLAEVRGHLDAEAPALRPLFDIMAGEARFARAWLDQELQRLSPSAAILEVGSGVFLLACQLAREGYDVTAVEPTAVGFGAFEDLGSRVLALAARDGAVPRVARSKVEEFTSEIRVSFAFSMNVMEHVESPSAAVATVSALLAPGASYRFLCPNYLFPYEPHFNMATFGSKALTARLMRRHIERCTAMEDPGGVWKSLNWISVPQVKRIANEDDSLALRFHTGTLVWMLGRALSDPAFASRRSKWMILAVRALRATGLLRLAGLVPAELQPIMDVRLTKRCVARLRANGPAGAGA
jgi:SAM-dependent methyltransferase